ncbi:hypothetical protein K4G58_07075 [Helicobacter sp. Faydin-H64]|nr:hypothetical protein [Helicobacter turcicus]
MRRFENQENLLQVETPTPSTNQTKMNDVELMNQNSSGAKTLSIIDSQGIIPQFNDSNHAQSQTKIAIQEFSNSTSLKAKDSTPTQTQQSQQRKHKR